MYMCDDITQQKYILNKRHIIRDIMSDILMDLINKLHFQYS